MPGQKASEEARRAQILRAAYEVAARRGLDALTLRLVAERAGLSPALILFHFESKEQLIVTLLDDVLALTTVLHVPPEVAAIRAPVDRFLELLRREMTRVSSDRRRIRLFFDYWAQGFRHPIIRARMQDELDRYREAFRGLATEVLAAEPARFADVTAIGLAGVAVSFIKGCAVQSMIDPRNFDVDEYLAAASGLLGQLRPRTHRHTASTRH
ncbi:MAG TPA: TetR/AcrR family transcriptional regulator [Gemmatimonadaceae bacterium]